jgi:hypothetical protein
LSSFIGQLPAAYLGCRGGHLGVKKLSGLKM